MLTNAGDGVKPETKFRNNVVYPFLRGLRNIHYFSIQQTTLVGHPDMVICLNGHFVALELKDVDGHLSAIQNYHLQQVENAGGLAFVASLDNWDVVKHRLTLIDQGEYKWEKILPLSTRN